jgi:hypothetical protein
VLIEGLGWRLAILIQKQYVQLLFVDVFIVRMHSDYALLLENHIHMELNQVPIEIDILLTYFLRSYKIGQILAIKKFGIAIVIRKFTQKYCYLLENTYVE